MFQLNLFKAKLAEHQKTVENTAKMLGINSATLYRKMYGKSEFTRDEIQKLRKFLKMTLEETERIFFAE